jgi:hypothetical protein
MGYYMNQQSAEFKIKKTKVAKALAAIQALAKTPERMGGGSSTGEKWYSWVDMKELADAKTLPDALVAWRWSGFINDAGDLVEIDFDGEKLGDDAILLEAIAPFVEKGSYIEMEGEEGCHWKWCFDGKTMTEKQGRVVYED